MRRLLMLLTMMFIMLPSFADGNPNGESQEEFIDLDIEIHEKEPKRLRMPIKIDIEVFYSADNKIVEIIYNGESEGMVYLFHEEMLVTSSGEINTILPIDQKGNYRLLIETDSWTASGSFQILY